jgi:hypothetical protein
MAVAAAERVIEQAHHARLAPVSLSGASDVMASPPLSEAASKARKSSAS